ncbi:MAG: heme ABC exporter ATP-binding protein CcmA [Sphingomonadales bacterium]
MSDGLEAENLACVRGERLVFEGLGFRLAPGAALVVRGPNGSGKSSLLRLVAGLIKPAAGALRWNGAPVDDEPEAYRAQLCYVGHLDAVKPVFTVEENLTLWTALSGADPARAESALAAFGLASLATLPARFLSAGQKRRLNLARIAASPAKLWLLDEPTVSLDHDAVGALISLIADHRRAGGMVMVSTHVDLALSGAGEVRLGQNVAEVAA